MNGSLIRRVWEKKGFAARFVWLLLWPASCLYRVAVQVRNAFYSVGWLPVSELPRPVVSVGNLTVGGTGKTPTALWLAEKLEGRGLKVAILSRGYKRKRRSPVLLEPNGKAAGYLENGDEVAEAGDEPLMMARVFQRRVGVGRKRYEAGRQLLQKTEVDLFILDDGFQHRELKRDFDLLLLGSDAWGSLLPAGPFREPRSALRRADSCLVTGSTEKWRAILSNGGVQRCFFGALQPQCLVGFERNQWKEHPLSLLDRSKILTATAIASPGPFYRMIHDWEGEIVEALEFPDHHTYSSRDWQRINRAARAVDFIVTTEKDILKLIRFPFARDKLLALRVGMVVENGDALIDAIVATADKKRTPG